MSRQHDGMPRPQVTINLNVGSWRRAMRRLEFVAAGYDDRGREVERRVTYDRLAHEDAVLDLLDEFTDVRETVPD